ncbi:MBL fold metallo-hydrolase [Rhizobium anhuiense]|nr:MBL fold metallo-hydrolase [Rhizobium anhuiense]
MVIGDVIVTALYDGTVAINPLNFAGVTDGQRLTALKRLFLATEGKIDTAVNAWIIDTGSRVILVDAGSGTVAGPTMGRLLENLEAAGYKAGAVNALLITHLHIDHVSGAADEQGKAVFPNATMYAAKADADFWLNDATQATLPEEQDNFVKFAKDGVAPYAAASRFVTFSDGDVLEDGLLTVVAFPGHTPGHSGFRLERAGETLLFWGDIAHLPAVQLAHASATISLDIDPAQAVASRERALKLATDTGWLIAGSHAPFPGIGRVRKDADGHSWVPAEYAALPVRG